MRFRVLLVALVFSVTSQDKASARSESVGEGERNSHRLTRREIPPGPPIGQNQPTPSAVGSEPPSPNTAEQTPSPRSSSTRTRPPVTNNTTPNVTVIPTNRTIVNITEDYHKYYKSRYYSLGAKWWYDLEKSATPTLHEELSKSSKFAYDTIKISFKFPYYGHFIDDVTITNKGYVFLGEVVHKFNASDQYVAPLMADFTTRRKTRIRYVDTGDRFTVEWENLRFQNLKVGKFSFQCSILKNGTLIFAYKNIPVPVAELKSKAIQVRVGLTDSYLRRFVKRGLFVVNGRIRTFLIYNVYYKYHSIDLPMEKVKSNAAFVITPLPNCVLFTSCASCVNSKTSFSCAWCSRLQRCSDGIDRHRQDWIAKGCSHSQQKTCPTPPKPDSSKGQGNANKTVENQKQTNTNTTLGNKNQGKVNKTIGNPDGKGNKTIGNQQQGKTNKTTGKQEQGKANITTGNQGHRNGNKTSEKPEDKRTNKTVDNQHLGKISTTLGTPTEANDRDKTNKTPDFNQLNKTVDSNVSNTSNNTTGPLVKPKGIKGSDVKANQNTQSSSAESSGALAGKIFSIVLALGVVVALICWFVYAYRHPQTKSGRFLIEHRNPKKWFRNDDYGSTKGKAHFHKGSVELKNN